MPGLLGPGLGRHRRPAALHTRDQGLAESSGCLESALRVGIAGGADHRSEQGVRAAGRRERFSAQTPHIRIVDLCP